MKAEVMLGQSPGLWLPEEGRSWAAGWQEHWQGHRLSCPSVLPSGLLPLSKDHAAALLTQE